MHNMNIKTKLNAKLNEIKRLIKKYRFDDLRKIYAIPLLITVIMFTVSGFNAGYIIAYLTSVLVIAGLFIQSRNAKKALLASYALIMVGSLCYNTVFAKPATDYAQDFEQAFTTMHEHYVLTKEKGIDWDALYAKYKPLFEKADQTSDETENYKTWLRFTNEFYDGHTAYMIESQSHQAEVMMRSFGNDYGLSIVRLSTGEYVAANVEGYENSYSADKGDEDDYGFYKTTDSFLPEEYEDIRTTLKDAGIKNGTVITAWNGRPIDEYFAQIDYYLQAYPVRENEEFYRPIYVAGIGENMEYGETCNGDENETNEKGRYALITYIDDEGNAKEIKAPRLGAYMPRLYDTIHKIDAGENVTNLTWKSIDDDTVLLRISSMAYDEQSYGKPEMYEDMVSKLREEVITLKESGISNLIIDLRSNSGGDPFFVQNVAGLFAPKGEHVNVYTAVINEKTATFERDENGRYIPAGPLTYTGEDLWHDGKIILLVNAECISAGDDMTYIMGEYPNVKVCGITRSNSSCQAVTGIRIGKGYLSFSAVPNIDENGNVVVDTLTNRVGRTPFDEYIPFDLEFVRAVFDRGEDPQLKYVTENYMN